MRIRILSFRIENFRNLRFVECVKVPNFMVIGGVNGCGKSALLEAIMTAKERAGAYGNFNFDPRTVSADAQKATITLVLEFSEKEREFVKKKFNNDCPEVDEIVVEIDKGGSGRVTKRSKVIMNLLSYYSHSKDSPGFFDYINAYRQMKKSTLQTWDSSFLSDQTTKQTLALSIDKFQHTKKYLAGLKMGDLQEIQSSYNSGQLIFKDSLKEIRNFFNKFFKPMQFKDVYLNFSPFKFVISTPIGEIDIDDLSSGEKEVFNIFIRFHQLKPKQSIILFDEIDVHLHPDLERRYLELLRDLGYGNQLILTTHSSEMMLSAGTESLYTILKYPAEEGGNQLKRVTESEELHEILSELLGSKGIISLNQKVIFIEGTEASVDRLIYESLYPPIEYNVNFVPVGNAVFLRSITERINNLLTTSTSFQQYFSIIDGDIERLTSTSSKRLFQLPVYHIENFLLDEDLILETTKDVLGLNCPYSSSNEVLSDLKILLHEDSHLNRFTKALLDNQIMLIAKDAYNAVFKNEKNQIISPRPDFFEVKEEAKKILRTAILNNTWKNKCKGRDLIKAYCGKHGIKYEHFRNILISKIKKPPEGLKDIMDLILNDSA